VKNVTIMMGNGNHQREWTDVVNAWPVNGLLMIKVNKKKTVAISLARIAEYVIDEV